MKNLLNKWYHKKVHINMNGLTISVIILDIKERWGRTRFLVSPETGSGEIWVENFIGLTA